MAPLGQLMSTTFCRMPPMLARTVKVHYGYSPPILPTSELANVRVLISGDKVKSARQLGMLFLGGEIHLNELNRV